VLQLTKWWCLLFKIGDFEGADDPLIGESDHSKIKPIFIRRNHAYSAKRLSSPLAFQ